MSEKREKHHRYPWPVIELATVWYQRNNLTFRAVSDLMLERGVEVSHKTVYEWVQKFGRTAGKISKKAAAKVAAGTVEEQYVKVNGEFKYLYRSIDKEGLTSNLVLKSRKDLAGARSFLKKSLKEIARD